MVTVAVAGGLGNVGRTIVEVLKQTPQHQVLALTRNAPDETPDFPVQAVNYDDIDSIASLLESNGVEVVISAIQVARPESGASEVNLAKAAAKSSVTKRFVASEWSAVVPDSQLGPHDQIRKQTRDFLQQETDLEWTRFICGHFLMDYAGLPYIKSYMKPNLHWGIDVENKAAAIPGSGDEIITFTYTYDLANFVVAALDLPKWDEATICYSEKSTWNKVVKLAEDVRGSDFKVAYDPVDTLKKGEITELPAQVPLYSFLPKEFLQGLVSRWGLMAIEGRWDVPEENSLNEIFPQIKTTTIKDALEHWRGK